MGGEGRKRKVIAYDSREPIVQTALRLAMEAHPVRVITPGMGVQAEAIHLGFTCAKGCFHEWRLVEATSGAGRRVPAWQEGDVFVAPGGEEIKEDSTEDDEEDDGQSDDE